VRGVLAELRPEPPSVMRSGCSLAPHEILETAERAHGDDQRVGV